MIESATMNNVYSNAYLNIAAGLAKHSEEGLFRERNALPLAACHIKTSCSCTTEEWISCTGSISGVDSGPLHDRAWVVQELLLSPRVLTFGREQLGWQCFEKSCTETDLDASYYNRPKRWIAGLETWNRGTLNLNGPNIGTWQSFRESSWRDSPIYVWQQITQSYCRTGLTFERDKLVAISGIANKMDKSTQGQLGSYLSGLWEHDLWKQLTWKADPGVCRRPAVYRAPSWSWASVEGPVRASNGPVQETCRYVMTIIEAKTTALQDPFGAVTAGHLKVSGKLCCISLREKEPIKPVLKPSAPKDSDGTDSDDDESDEGSWCPWDRVDIQGAVFEGPDLWASADDHNAWLQFQKDRTPLYIMPVYEEQDWGLTAFVLRPTGQKDGQFSRVGLVDPYKEGIVKALNEAMVSQVLPDELHQGLDELGMYMIEIV